MNIGDFKDKIMINLLELKEEGKLTEDMFFIVFNKIFDENTEQQNVI